MDYPLPDQEEHVRLSDVTLVIPESVCQKLQNKFGNKVRLMKQSIWLAPYLPEVKSARTEPLELAQIPRPRLGYLGPIENRVDLELLRKVLAGHRSWHFVSFGSANRLRMSNSHVVPWRKPSDLPQFIANLDLGFMPYDCSDDKNLHCVPLKLFDYFAMGLPVVSTPVVNLLKYRDLIYFGSDVEELGQATMRALQEPPDSPKRRLRTEIAEMHSVENLTPWLLNLLLEEGVQFAHLR